MCSQKEHAGIDLQFISLGVVPIIAALDTLSREHRIVVSTGSLSLLSLKADTKNRIGLEDRRSLYALLTDSASPEELCSGAQVPCIIRTRGANSVDNTH